MSGTEGDDTIPYGPKTRIGRERLGFNGWDNHQTVEKGLNPFEFVVITLAGWMNQRQQNVIEYLREENRVLRKQLGIVVCGSDVPRFTQPFIIENLNTSANSLGVR